MKNRKKLLAKEFSFKTTKKIHLRNNGIYKIIIILLKKKDVVIIASSTKVQVISDVFFIMFSIIEKRIIACTFYQKKLHKIEMIY